MTDDEARQRLLGEISTLAALSEAMAALDSELTPEMTDFEALQRLTASWGGLLSWVELRAADAQKRMEALTGQAQAVH